MRRRKLRAIYRLNRRRIRHLWQAAGRFRSMRGVFHWRYSAVLIFFLYALGMSMIGIGLAVDPFHKFFILAYCFFAGSLMWAIGWWLTSEALSRKKPKLIKKQKKQNAEVSYASYRAWQWGVIVLMVAAFWGSLKLTSDIETDRELSLLGGKLVPANDPTPSNICIVQRDEVAIYLGQNAIKTDNFPLKIISIRGNPVVSLDRNADGSMALSLDVRSDDNRLIARMDRGTFTVNQNNYFSMKRKDRSSLIVLDQYGTKVLDVRFANPRCFLLNAELYSSGRHVSLKGIPIYEVCITVQKGATVTDGVIGFN